MHSSTLKLLNFVNKNSLAIISYLLIYLFALYFVTIKAAPWGDEIHFLITIQQFASAPFITTLHNYDELFTQLRFFTYALLCKITGMQLASLRLLSIFIASFTYLNFNFLFSILFTKAKKFYIIFSTLNPYLIGSGVFVFTFFSFA